MSDWLLPMYKAMVNSPSTVLSEDITADQTEIPVEDASKLPDAPNLAVIGTTYDAETILYLGKSGDTLTNCTRGFQGMASAWDAGTPVTRTFTAYDHDTFIDNIVEIGDRIDDLNEKTGDMTKSTYDTDADGRVDKAESLDDGTYSVSAADVADAVSKAHSEKQNEPQAYVSQSQGESDAGKGVLLNGDGMIDNSMLPQTMHESYVKSIAMRMAIILGG